MTSVYKTLFSNCLNLDYHRKRGTIRKKQHPSRRVRAFMPSCTVVSNLKANEEVPLPNEEEGKRFMLMLKLMLVVQRLASEN